jgi:tetratricopeptide (TPR) repeat protein
MALAYNNLGWMLLDQRKFKEAIIKFRKAIELDPKGAALAYRNWGVALEEQGDRTGAIVKYNAAVKIDPYFALVHEDLGDILVGDDREGAIREYQRAVDLGPTSATAHNKLVTILHQQGRVHEAVAEYRRFGLALYQQDRAAAAIVEYQKAMALDPTNAEVRQALDIALKTRDGGDKAPPDRRN